jgi:hypothetical protein
MHVFLADRRLPGPTAMATGRRPAELITTALLFISMVLSWIALWRVGFGHQVAHDSILPFILAYACRGGRTPISSSPPPASRALRASTCIAHSSLRSRETKSFKPDPGR